MLNRTTYAIETTFLGTFRVLGSGYSWRGGKNSWLNFMPVLATKFFLPENLCHTY